MRNIDNPVYHSESGIAAAIVDDRYAEIGQTSRNQAARFGHVTTAGGLNPGTAPSLHPQISENSASVGKGPSPYLVPQPSLGRENRIIIKECCKMQTMKQLGSGRFAAYTNIVAHVVPTDPQTGYSTLLRPDEVRSHSVNFNPVDRLYDSIKEKDKCVLGPSGDKMVAQMSSKCSMSPSDSKPQAACSTENPGEHIKFLYESTGTAKVSSPEIVAPIIDPETGYSVLRPDKVLAPPPGPRTGSVLPYDTIKLNSSCLVKQRNSDGEMSHSNTSSIC